MYMTLRNYYSYDADHIFLLTPRDTHPTSGNTVPRDRFTSLENVQWAINQIAWLSDADDKVLIWWTGHGTNASGGLFDTGSSDAYITPTQLDTALDMIRCTQMLIFLGPCFSGIFIDELKESNRIIYTSSLENELSHASVSAYSVWDRATYYALDPDFSAHTADTDSNGKISLWEVYDYANNLILNRFDDQHPQRWVGLNFRINNRSDANEYIADGYYII